MAAHSSILAWRIPRGRGVWRATVYGIAESDTPEQITTAQSSMGFVGCLLLSQKFLRKGIISLLRKQHLPLPRDMLPQNPTTQRENTFSLGRSDGLYQAAN